jgi:hypothetical protein
MAKRPYFLSGAALGSGYLWAMLRRIKRPVSKELMKFHRKEQMHKLSAILRSVLTFQPLDSFAVLPESSSSNRDR